MSKKWYLSLLGAVSLSVIAGVAAFGQNTGQIIVTTPTGNELIALQTLGPQSAAISTTNLATWVNAGGGVVGPGAFTTLSASSTVSGAGFTARFATPGPIGSTVASTGAFTTLGASGNVTLSPTGTVAISPSSTVAISPTGALTVNPTAASTIDNASIGVTTPLAGKFTTLAWTTAGAVGTFGTDATHTTATVCEDTTSHAIFFGSGAAGICAGTSSLRFKHDVIPLEAGLKEVLALEPIRYKLNADHGDPDHELYGFSAEQGGTVLPVLMGSDPEGRPNSFDHVGVIPVLVKAIQEQQAQIEELKRQLSIPVKHAQAR
jgi:hypothetical protein